MTRKSTIKRSTAETVIHIELNLDGCGETAVNTGFGIADHMITLLAFWAGFDAKVECRGDLNVDAHHSVEDVALCLGQALLEALGDKKGIARAGWAFVPMDEALSHICLDLSGRAFLVFNGEELLPPSIAGEERALWREFFKSLAAGARMNLHVNMQYGNNGHHLLESACKGIGLALRQACRVSGDKLPSTKGSLDS